MACCWYSIPGQIVAAKVRLVGAADAAAYSAAVWQARALNFQAYMNRGIVANEVATAQLVSLRSWSAYMNQVAAGGRDGQRRGPAARGAMQALARGWDTMKRVCSGHSRSLEAAASRWNVEVLSRAEYIADLQTPAVAASLARDVAVANVPELRSASAGRVFALDDARRWQALDRWPWPHWRATHAPARGGDGVTRWLQPGARLDDRRAAAAHA